MSLSTDQVPFVAGIVFAHSLIQQSVLASMTLARNLAREKMTNRQDVHVALNYYGFDCPANDSIVDDIAKFLGLRA